ncbi:MAG: GNAT family N-acetyltransferase [Alphaproteobacteria bacterium]|nr:MAG: GNAT family N-acetyltransferase [Alphaproteobacteria bacterium]
MDRSSNHAPVRIRWARSADAATIVRLIRELAVFEKLEDHVRVTEADILRDGFGPQPRFECLLAEVDGVPAGFALFFPNYSTFEGRPGLYLEDIYVVPEARGSGVGRALMARLARIACERGWTRFDLSVLHWNPARAFYERLGFDHGADWLGYRLEGHALARLAEEGGET